MTAKAPAVKELVRLIRKALPSHKELTRLRADEQLGLVELTWYSHEFVVKPPCDVLELIGHDLKLTGTAMLVQAALRSKRQDATEVEEVIEAIKAAEELMPGNTNRGFALLEEVKTNLVHLARKPEADSRRFSQTDFLSIPRSH